MSSNNQKKLKAGIYDPYLDTLGGGERYVLTVAKTLADNGYDVDLFWSGDKNYLDKASKRFSLDLSTINIVRDIFNHHPVSTDLLEEERSLSDFTRPLSYSSFHQKVLNFINKINTLSRYDIVFYLSDGSLPFLFAKQNIVHFQVPFMFKLSKAQNFLNLFKFIFIKHIVCNSKFTSQVFSKSFNHKNVVLYPPVDIDKFTVSNNKENIILSVGRFDNLLNTKKQDILIQAFSKMLSLNPTLSWKLILAGGSKENPDTNQYLKHLFTLAKNLPIEILVNPSFEDLINTYAKSKIYWHAAGYGVDQSIHPENTEHFGITVVEAMSSGLVPVVVNQGGLPEIVSDEINGFLWDDIKDLISKTNKLIESPRLLEELSNQAKQSSHKFSISVFEKNLLKLIK